MNSNQFTVEHLTTIIEAMGNVPEIVTSMQVVLEPGKIAGKIERNSSGVVSFTPQVFPQSRVAGGWRD